MKKALFVLTCIMLLALASCQDPGLLLPGLDPGTSKSLVTTVEPGSILKSGDMIPLSISNSTDASQNPDNMTVRLMDGMVAVNPTLISEIKFTRQQLLAASLPGMTVPDLKTGMYKLIFLMYQGANLLRQESVLFFVGHEKPILSGIVVQPGTLIPGGDGILELLLDLPEGSDVWIRWDAGSTMFKTALASAGGKRITFIAPVLEGVYTYRAEVFPQAPPAGGDYSFKSPYFVENRIVVANRASATSTDLGPDSDFPHVLHLMGTLADSGWARTKENAPTAFSFVGKRLFDLQHDILGYILGNGGAIHYPAALIPDFSHQFPAMATQFHLIPIDLKPGIIYRSRNNQGTSGLELSVATATELALRIWGKGFDQQTKYPVALELGAPTEIQLCLARSGNSTQLLLIIGGKVVGSISIETSDDTIQQSEKALPGETQIGSITGPSFLLDEFGIYQPQALVQDAYYLAMAYRYGKALSFASAFSSGIIPAGFQVQGDVRVENGFLLIPPGASIILPPFQNLRTPVNLEIAFAEGSSVEGGLVSLESKGVIAGVINLNGTVAQGSRLEKIAGFNLHPLNFTIQPGKAGFELVWPSLVFPIQASNTENLTIRIAQGLRGLAALEISHVGGIEQLPDNNRINP